MAAKTPPPRRPGSSKSSKPSASKAAKPPAKSGSKSAWEIIQSAYMAMAHGMGGLIRAFSTEKLAADDRRDGAPFFLFLLSILGALFAWFLVNEPVAQTIHQFT
ncbi:MAG: cell division protein FtsK, partial [Aquiluna sp.]